jgi:hypothetical protein
LETPSGNFHAVRRSRATLGWGLTGFAALQLGLAFAIEYVLPQLREPVYAWKAAGLSRRTTAAGARAPAVVMLGSSRTAFGLTAGPLEDVLVREVGGPVVVFNFGLNGAGPVTELLILKRLLAEGRRPDLLLIEVLPPLLAGQTRRPAEARWLDPTALWFSELPVLKRYRFPVRKIRRRWCQAWPLPWYTRRINVLSQVVPSWLPWEKRQDWFRTIDGSGWAAWPLPNRDPERYRRDAVEARRAYEPFLTGFRLGGPSCRALQAMLERCRQEAIPTALVLMPETAEFRRWYSPAAWEQVQTYLAGLSREYGAPLINAREWVADEDFIDTQHLLPRGAEVFSRRLGQDVRLVLARAQGATVAAHR